MPKRLFVLCYILSHVFSLRSLPPIDAYSGRRLNNKHFSCEHVIPKRHFLSRAHANDLLNLVPCDRHINNLRSDYKYGHPHAEHIQHPSCKKIYNQHLDFCGFINTQSRTYYPPLDADLGMLGRSIKQLLFKYPYLYHNLLDIVDSPSTLAIWCMYPVSDFEIARNQKATHTNEVE